jgi:dienelactone hydrolase
LVPTRVGYGESGGPDVEDSGACESRRYEPVYAAAAAQSHAVLAAARALPYVDTGRGLVVGQSFGGATAIALAASDLPGLRGAVNFAGGGGGNPDTHPELPCSPQALQRLFTGYGGKAKVKTLWLYSVNDRFWGPDLPKAWFAAYQAQGGQGRFVSLPPYKDNGHGIFSGNPAAWQADFAAFVRELGF